MHAWVRVYVYVHYSNTDRSHCIHTYKCTRTNVHVECTRTYESSFESDMYMLGCAALLCLVVCLTLLASFSIPSSSLIKREMRRKKEVQCHVQHTVLHYIYYVYIYRCILSSMSPPVYQAELHYLLNRGFDPTSCLAGVVAQH